MRHEVKFNVTTDRNGIPIAIIKNHPIRIACSISIEHLPFDGFLSVNPCTNEAIYERVTDTLVSYLNSALASDRDSVTNNCPPAGFGYLVDVCDVVPAPLQSASIGIETIKDGDIYGFIYIGCDGLIYHSILGRVPESENMTGLAERLIVELGCSGTSFISIEHMEHAVHEVSRNLCSLLSDMFNTQQNPDTVISRHKESLHYFAMEVLQSCSKRFAMMSRQYEARWDLYREGDCILGKDSSFVICRSTYGQFTTRPEFAEYSLAVFNTIDTNVASPVHQRKYYFDTKFSAIDFVANDVSNENEMIMDGQSKLGTFVISTKPDDSSVKCIIYKNYKNGSSVIVLNGDAPQLNMTDQLSDLSVEFIPSLIDTMIHVVAREHFLDESKLSAHLREYGLGLVQTALGDMISSMYR